MFREVVVSDGLGQNVKDAIESMRDSETPVVLRSTDTYRLDKDKIGSFLLEDCGLEMDRRQFKALDHSLELADWWEISNQPDKDTTYAHSTTYHPFHNDNAWFSDPAEYNAFFMEKQAPVGGAQLIYPFSRLVEDLMSEDKDLFSKLCDVHVKIKKGNESHENYTPIICEDKVYWNYYRTDKSDPIVQEMCDRFFNFLHEKSTSNSVFELYCNTGDGFILNDQKTLHARTSFEVTMPRDRILWQSMWNRVES